MTQLYVAQGDGAKARVASQCVLSAALAAAWLLSFAAQAATPTMATPTPAPTPPPTIPSAPRPASAAAALTTSFTTTTPFSASTAPSTATPLGGPVRASTSTPAGSTPAAATANSAATGAARPPPPSGPPSVSPAAAISVTPAPEPVPVQPAAPIASPAAPATQGSAPVFAAPGFTPAARAEEEPAFEPGQLLVLWTSEEAAASGLATLLSRYQQRPRQRYTLGSLGFTVAMLALPTDRQATALLAQLRAEQPDWVVDRNARSMPMQANPDAAAPRLYAQKMLGGSAQTTEAPSLRIGVVDSGLDSTLAQAAALNGSTITLRSVLGPADKPAATTHGDAVLQLLVGKAQANGFAGSAPPALLHWASAMRELGGKPSTNSLTLVLALDWLLGQQVALVNMSLGGQGDAVLKAAIDKLISKNIAIVAAVGNNPASNAPATYPAAYPGVWAVTAVDAAGKLYAQAHRASYASIAAPGVELWVPSADAAGSYLSGTSYATALASAALAWQPATFWLLPPAQQRTQVCAQARKLDAVAYSGCGLVQKAAAP